jgi:hypothetical protein
MEPYDQDRLTNDPDKDRGWDVGIVFGMIPIFAIIGCLLAVVAGLMLPGYSALLFGLAILLGIGAAVGYAARVSSQTRGRV